MTLIKQEDELREKIELILTKFAAYCDSTNREIEYDTSDNIDFDEAIDQLTVLLTAQRQAVIDSLPKKQEITLKEVKYGSKATANKAYWYKVGFNAYRDQAIAALKGIK